MTDDQPASAQLPQDDGEEIFADCACSGKNLPKLVSPMILAILSRESAHGYRIAQRIEQQFEGMFVPNHSSIYRILNTMELGGFVCCHLEEPTSGPVRKVYEITEKGHDCLKEWARSLSEFRDAVDDFLEMVGEGTS